MFNGAEILATFLFYSVSTEFHPAFVKFETWWKNTHFRPTLVCTMILETFLMVCKRLQYSVEVGFWYIGNWLCSLPVLRRNTQWEEEGNPAVLSQGTSAWRPWIFSRTFLVMTLYLCEIFQFCWKRSLYCWKIFGGHK